MKTASKKNGFMAARRRILVLATLIALGGALPLYAQVDIDLDKSSDYATAKPGDVLTFTIVALNAGPDPATGLSVDDVLDGAFEYIDGSDTATDGAVGFAAGTVTWSGVSVAAGGSQTLTFQVYVTTTIAGTYANTASVTAVNEVDSDPANDVTAISVEVADAGAFPSNVVVQALDFFTFVPPTVGDPDLIYPIVGTFNFGVYRGTPDAVVSNGWMPVLGTGLPLPLYVSDVLTLSDGTVAIATWGNDGVYLSTDGRVWNAVDFPVQGRDDSEGNSIVYALAEAIDATIYASADRGRIFRSFDGGITWELAGLLPGASADTPWSLATSPTDADVVYGGLFGRSVYVSGDKGETWAPFDDTGMGQVHIFDIEFDPADPDMMYVATGIGVYRYDTAGGGPWEAINDGLVANTGFGPIEVRDLAFDPVTGFLRTASWGFGVFETDVTIPPVWSQVALRWAHVHEVATHPITGELYILTEEHGVVRLSPAELTAIDPASTEVPDGYSLSQNYPNPFNPSTQITFDLPEASVVRLSVFDVLGREVALLAEGRQTAGAHQVNFDASNLPSGVYLYRLETPGQTLTRSMILAK